MFDTHHTQHFVVIWTYDHPATTESRTDARAPYIMMCLMLLLTETCAFEARSERRRGGQHQDHNSQTLIMILYAVSKSLAQWKRLFSDLNMHCRHKYCWPWSCQRWWEPSWEFRKLRALANTSKQNQKSRQLFPVCMISLDHSKSPFVRFVTSLQHQSCSSSKYLSCCCAKYFNFIKIFASCWSV